MFKKSNMSVSSGMADTSNKKQKLAIEEKMEQESEDEEPKKDVKQEEPKKDPNQGEIEEESEVEDSEVEESDGGDEYEEEEKFTPAEGVIKDGFLFQANKSYYGEPQQNQQSAFDDWEQGIKTGWHPEMSGVLTGMALCKLWREKLDPDFNMSRWKCPKEEDETERNDVLFPAEGEVCLWQKIKLPKGW